MRRLILLICSLMICLPSQAGQIILGAAVDSPAVRSFTADLAQKRPQDQVSFMSLKQLKVSRPAADARLIILDRETLDWRLQQNDAPATLVMRVSRIEGAALLGERPPVGVTLLWSDPPPERQLRLARLLLPNSKSVGLLFDSQSAFLVDEYRRAAEELGLELQAKPWNPDGSRKPLLALLETTDLLLGIDAPRLYNADTIKSLLLTSYAQNRALLGPTASFVRAGSLASTYSDQQDWLAELDTWLDQSPAEWPASAYPMHFKVVSNRQVARALGLAPASDETLTRHLSEGEAR
jgi:hypothetical protein